MTLSILERQNPWWKTGKLSYHLFPRSIEKELIKNLENNKILALLGSRQVGKTSLLYLLIQHLLKTVKSTDIYYFNLDDLGVRRMLESPNDFLNYIGTENGKKYIFLDEAQRLQNPGLFLKTIFDLKLDIKLIVSGSSQLELRSKLKEFLVGRMRIFEIQRLNFLEALTLHPNVPPQTLMEHMMLYGGYPEVLGQKNDEEKKLLLNDIHQMYIEKDISDFAKVENVDAFNKLLILLAAQIGGLLNVHGLSKTLKIPIALVGRYLDILEGTFIVKRLMPFFKNYKKEISKTPKIYFLDLGLRNLLLNQWQSLELRTDTGALFENFIFLEMYSRDFYKERDFHFWRTTNQTEIDLIIEGKGSLHAIETKWQKSSMPKSFSTFKTYYPKSATELITAATFLSKTKSKS
ncbi:ATP-binding protein [Candidatus Peregrinibacteria bacterium]|nr:ATP-binding protein [Candidatus Peregrinibacteria bacterium]